LSTFGTADLKALLECLLFVSCEPLNEGRLASLTQNDISTIRALLEELAEEYKGRGFELKQIADGWQFLTRKEFIDYVEKLYRPRLQQLSRAALETLAIIAYQQPITRLEIEQIRQVNSDSVVSKLMEKGLICEMGRRESVGKPVLYGTTGAFLQFFGLSSLSQLPPLAPSDNDKMQENPLLFPEVK